MSGLNARVDKRYTDTRERILMTALRLFARQGFEATSVAEIAQEVGVSAPALYKHFDNKWAIFEELMKFGARGYDMRMNKLHIEFLPTQEDRVEFVHASTDRQVRIVQSAFRHTVEEEAPSLFRMLMTVEQHNMPGLARQFNERYVNRLFDAAEKLMRTFVEEGMVPDGDTRMLAVQYASPIIVYIEACDREPHRKREALDAIARLVRHFNATNLFS